jgi:hypothetical protein
MSISAVSSFKVAADFSSTFERRLDAPVTGPLKDGMDPPPVRADGSSDDACKKAQNKYAATELAFFGDIVGIAMGGGVGAALAFPAAALALGEAADEVAEKCKQSNDPKQGSDNTMGAGGNNGTGGMGGSK